MKISQSVLKSFFLSLLPVMACSQWNPISYSNPGFVYTQNFDSLPISINYTLANKGPFSLQAPPILINAMPSWFLMQTAGSAIQAGWIAGSGTSTNHGIYSTGAMNVKERSLGSLASSGGSYVFGLILINQTGKTLNQFSIAAQIEQWRKGGSGKKNTWYCRAKTGNWQALDTSNWIACPEGNFSSPVSSIGVTSLNGNLPENQQSLNFQINRLAWKNGEKLLIAWYDPDEAGNDDLCSIDLFQFSANQLIIPPKIDSFRIDSLTYSEAVFSCQLTPGGGNTFVEWEWDTIPAFNFPENQPAIPSTIPDYENNIRIKGRLTQVTPGYQYFVRLIANNDGGSTISEPFTIQIPNLPPRIESFSPTIINSNQVEMYYKVTSIGNSQINTSGIQIATNAEFLIFSTIISTSTTQGLQKCVIDKLPAGTKIWLRGFAINENGLFTGNVVNVTTPTTIAYFKLTGPETTSSNSIYYNLQTTQPLQGLSPKSFSVISDQIKEATVLQISGTQNNYTIAVSTGKGDGKLQLQINANPFTEPGIFPSPFVANGICEIDKTPPLIQKLYYANHPYHSGDTIQLFLQVEPEKNNLKMVSGKWAGILIPELQKINDSIFVANLVLPEAKWSITKEAGIPVMMQVKDVAGNVSSIFQDTIFYAMDEVDLSIPTIIATQQPAERTYAAGDTLEWKLTFSEPVMVNYPSRKPYLSILIGTASRQASLSWIQDSSLYFRYIVKPGEIDSVGITWKKYVLLNGNLITDSIGNVAQLNFIENKLNKITVDGIAPDISQIILPAKKSYLLADSLLVTVQFSKKIQLIGEYKNVQFVFSTQTGNIAASLIGVNENQLIFRYNIPSRVWDKKGILPSSIQISSSATLQDIAGNPANLSLPGPYTNTGIFIDASIPFFQDSSETSISYCSSDSIVDVGKLFSWNSPEIGEKITINIEYYSGKQIIILPYHSFTATGTVQQPVIRLQNSDTSKLLPDTLIISLSDSFYTKTRKLIIAPIPAIQNNIIIGPPPICSGQAITSISGTVPYGGNGSFTYLWEVAASSLAPFTICSIPDTLSRFSLPEINQPLLLRRKIKSGPCTNYSGSIWIPVKGEGLWTGKKSGDWNDSGNWCREKIPTPEISVLIPGGTSFVPELNDVGFCDTLEILTAGKLLLNGRLQVRGNIVAPSSSIYAYAGSINFNGSKAQTILGSQFIDQTIGALQLQNNLGLSMLDTVKVNQSISIQKGFIETNQYLIMKEGAVVGPSAEGSKILGNVTVSTTVKSAKKQYVFNSHPFRNPQPLQVLANQIDITGPATANPPFAASANNIPSAFRLGNPLNGSCEDPKMCWKPFNSLNHQPTEYWKPMEGIRWLFRGRKGLGIDDQSAWLEKPFDSLQQVTLQFSGELNIGDQVLSFADTAEGFQLIGNPYLCPIDIRNLQFSDSIAPFCWIWNNTQGFAGGYTCYSITDSIVIPPFGTFIIKLNGKNPHQIVFSEKSKVDTKYSLTPRNQFTYPGFTIQLFQDSIYLDQVIIADDIRSFSGIDVGDGEKIMNPSHNLFTLTLSKQSLSIDKRPIGAKTYIPLVIDKVSAGNYQLRCNIQEGSNQEKVQLIDFYTLHYYPLNKDTIITFEVNSDTLHSSLQRFVIAGIQYSNEAIKPMELYPLTIFPNPVQDFVHIIFNNWPKDPCMIRILDAMGNVLRIEKKQFTANEILRINTTALPPGTHIIEIRNSNNSFRAIGKWIKQYMNAP